jgi:hypothetical protein
MLCRRKYQFLIPSFSPTTNIIATIVTFELSSNIIFHKIDLTDYSILPNGLVFISNSYSSFVLSRVENNFFIEPK